MKGAFDETSFDFSLVTGRGASDDTEGLLHTCVIYASATFKYGEQEGLPLPLQCTWYVVNPKDSE